MSNLIKTYHRWQRTGIPMTASIYPCPHLSNIQQLERINLGKNKDAISCNYFLGERIFLNIWRELGNVPFRKGSQRLYEQTQAGGVEEVKVAFNRPESRGTVATAAPTREPSRASTKASQHGNWMKSAAG